MECLNKPKSAKSKRKPSVRAKLLAEIKKKKECEKIALNIVIELIDGELEEIDMLNKLGFINASHYEDVVEERFIIKKCGYIACSEHLTSIPKHQYHISLTHNKVFDITERKKFCSNECYKCSKYLHNQLLTSPLWVRESETIPQFKLLSQPNSNKSQEINHQKKAEQITMSQDDTQNEKGNSSNDDLVEQIKNIKIQVN
ncbi:putative RNA polymerase II subunit B1 CTD phosphatase RPAP2 homolog [Adelges cooleyi]|uniref:putative RNA polymerase II subunit B1 CTD phosphatase RPAP2 homolog n=1 Tax=Adelges cooleyi TaxID=133065 RepID=UPI00217FC515|nr:putative RNA polymerase II subunit B1 CTD phosphatase RPAP2 homolog [Adelges cooleyi]